MEYVHEHVTNKCFQNKDAHRYTCDKYKENGVVRSMIDVLLVRKNKIVNVHEVWCLERVGCVKGSSAFYFRWSRTKTVNGKQ